MTGSDSSRFHDWQRQAMAAEVPLTAYLELTHRCNLRCAFCCNRRAEDNAALSLSEWCGVIAELRELGTMFVTLTGGEPLVHPHFFEIAEEIREHKMALRILTNGTLIDRHKAGRIAGLRPLSVEMSLHGATSETHDAATGMSGSFANLATAIQCLRELGVSIALKTPVTQANLVELERIVQLAAAEDVPLRFDPEITPRDDGDPQPLRYALDSDGIQVVTILANRLGTLSKAHRIAGGTNCGLGRSTVTIGPDGEIFPCVLWRAGSYGNVRSRSLRTAWSHPLRREVANISDLVNERALALGEPRSSRPQCPAIAERFAAATAPSGELPIEGDVTT